MRSALLAVLAAALLVPAQAAAQSAPFQPLPPAPEPAPQTVAAEPEDGGDGISALQQTLLIAGGVLFVLAIGFAIARDARRNAPTDARRGSRAATAGSSGDALGERRKPEPRAAEKQKAAAKRARQARKKNRPVRK